MRDRLIELTERVLNEYGKSNASHMGVDRVFLIIEKNGTKEIAEGVVFETFIYKDHVELSGIFLSLLYDEKFTAHSSSFGKTVFLTREEAERALKGGADNGKVY